MMVSRDVAQAVAKTIEVRKRMVWVSSARVCCDASCHQSSTWVSGLHQGPLDSIPTYPSPT